jgi:hypothetical protein
MLMGPAQWGHSTRTRTLERRRMITLTPARQQADSELVLHTHSTRTQPQQRQHACEHKSKDQTQAGRSTGNRKREAAARARSELHAGIRTARTTRVHAGDGAHHHTKSSLRDCSITIEDLETQATRVDAGESDRPPRHHPHGRYALVPPQKLATEPMRPGI